MISGQDFLFFLMISVQQMQHVLTFADKEAASHALKRSIRDQLEMLDQLESRLQILSVQRGWDVPEQKPIHRSLFAFRFRCRNDSSVAEHLILQYTDSVIGIMRQNNCWSADDSSIRILFQKYMDYCTVGIRQMQQYL